jgi:hypothetical protein
MIVGALVTMAFFFAYTEVKSNAQNLGFTCAISFCLVSRIHTSLSISDRLRSIWLSLTLGDNDRISTTVPFTPTL